MVGDVQDRYAGDLGDFLKLGLLRWLVPPGDAAHRLGVIWYLTLDEAHNADGKHVAYLAPASRAGRKLRQLDADLYDRLAEMVQSGQRSTAALANAGVLGPTTSFFNEVLDLSALPIAVRDARRAQRAAWLQRALEATAECGFVFADPDNGIRSVSHAAGSHRNKAEKHAYLDELARFAERGQSLVVYHHADRSAPVPEQARRRLEDLAREVPITPIAAVRASRGTTRLFLIGAASAPHEAYLRDRLEELGQSAWSSELTVYWSN